MANALLGLSGARRSASPRDAPACEICQFWQPEQSTLQPRVPRDRARVPGWKWKKGFFSISSETTDAGRPYTKDNNLPSRTPRTLQSPTCPSLIRQA